MRRIGCWFRFRELKAIKHALQMYVKRGNASQKDIEQEQEIIDQIDGILAKMNYSKE